MRVLLSLFLAVSILSLSIQSSHAKLSMLPTIEVIDEVSFNQDRETVLSFITIPEVQKEMINNGVNPQEAILRVASLSHSEVKNLAKQIEDAKAGGDFGAGSIIGAAIFVFLILLITDILGFTKVFPFTRSINH